MTSLCLILLIGFTLGTIEWQLLLKVLFEKLEWLIDDKYGYRTPDWTEKLFEILSDARILFFSLPLRIVRGIVGTMLVIARLSADPYHGWQGFFASGHTKLSVVLFQGIDILTSLVTKTKCHDGGNGYIRLLIDTIGLLDFSAGKTVGPIHISLITIGFFILLSLFFSISVSMLATAFIPEILIAIAVAVYIRQQSKYVYNSDFFYLIPNSAERIRVNHSIRKHNRQDRKEKEQKLKNYKKAEKQRTKRVNRAATENGTAVMNKREPLSDATANWEDAQDDFVGGFVGLDKDEESLIYHEKNFHAFGRENFVQYPLDFIDEIIRMTTDRADIRSENTSYVKDTEKKAAKKIRKRRLKIYFQPDFWNILGAVWRALVLPVLLLALYLSVQDYIYQAKRTHFWLDSIPTCIFSHAIVGVVVFFLVKWIIKIIAGLISAIAATFGIYRESNDAARKQMRDSLGTYPFFCKYQSNRQEDNYNVSARLSELQLLRVLSDPERKVVVYRDKKYSNVFYFFNDESEDRGLINEYDAYGVRGVLYYRELNENIQNADNIGMVKIDLLHHTIMRE